MYRASRQFARQAIGKTLDPERSIANPGERPKPAGILARFLRARRERGRRPQQKGSAKHCCMLDEDACASVTRGNQAASRSVYPKSPPLNSSGSRYALASA